MDRKSQRRAVIACLIGSAFEGIDFVAFGMLSYVLSRFYFPVDDEVASLLLTLATFGVGYVVRPLGGIFWGIYADRHGRQPALALLSIMMAVGKALIAVTPGYASIGAAAPAIIVVARLIQGFSLGGEFASATSLLLEYATPGRRGFYTSWQMFSQVVSVAAGSAGIYLLSQLLGAGAFAAWGWRLVFAVGLLIGPIGYYIRTRIDETPEYRDYRRTSGRPAETPLRDIVANYPWEMISGAGIVLAGTSVFYLTFIYLPIFAMRALGIGAGAAQLSTVAAAAASALVIL